MRELNDPLDDPLTAAFDLGGTPLAADHGLRSALLAQTIGVLRFRRRAKRCALAAGLLGCYLAGVTTMGLFRTPAQQQPVATPPMTAQSQPAPSRSPHASPNPIRNQLAVKKPTGFESWRSIGDHYLNQSGNISLAVAGYSEAIRLASDEERRISPERDNWLMMALKDARSKEKTHAYP
jgi:cytochrome c-type biogenesis protein CcmH/NrfG